MKVIIEHSKTKREIAGSFRACGNRKELLSIADQIRRQAEADGFSYGWVTVYADVPGTIYNEEPKKWDS